MTQQRTDWIDADKLKAINDSVYKRGHVDREHLLEILRSVDTTDAHTIIAEIKQWLTDLHNDPYYDKIIFPQGDIDAIIGDLDSYGYIQPITILKFKEDSVREVTQ